MWVGSLPALWHCGKAALPIRDQNDRHVKKHYLPATSFAGSKNIQNFQLNKRLQVKTSCVGCSATGSWSRTSTSTTASRSRPAIPRRTCTRRVCRNPRWRLHSAGGSSRTVRHRSQVNPHVSCVQILCHFFLLYILYINYYYTF